ncbi:Wzz/FepE/Etk N-terminal domain-containing protein [Kitasatospora sp. NPDC101235]|uniref:Wzz/FepE/Etk N-terminal domain-containing protein n=1 Tax=Kitasatospora sp. NPDC101235 TaxID=3364101 RepID=UPI00381EF6EF
MTTPRRSARRLVRRWWPVALAVPLGAAAGAGYAVVSHPSYSANAYVLVVAQNPGEAAIATNFAQAYGRLAGRPQVLAAAAAETGHTRSELASLVHGTTSPDAPMIEITGTGQRPQQAARAADAVARALVAFANTSSKDTNVRLVTLSPAAAPDRPTTPSGKLDVAVGGAAGLLLGALVMTTRRRGGRGTSEAAGSPGTAQAAQAPQVAQAPQAPEAPAAPVPVAVAVPRTPRPRSEEPAKAKTESKPASESKAEAEPKAEANPRAESETGAATEGTKAEGSKAEGAKVEDTKVNGSKGKGAKAEKKTAGKTDKSTGVEPGVEEQPPAEEQPAVAEQPPVTERPAARSKAPAGSGR